MVTPSGLWISQGVFKRIDHGLAEDLYKRGGIDLREAFIDETFVRQKKGPAVGKTKRGKDIKIMAVAFAKTSPTYPVMSRS
jgi:hypothetical protein